jgi:hypothetical protein
VTEIVVFFLEASWPLLVVAWIASYRPWVDHHVDHEVLVGHEVVGSGVVVEHRAASGVVADHHGVGVIGAHTSVEFHSSLHILLEVVVDNSLHGAALGGRTSSGLAGAAHIGGVHKETV